MVRSWINENGQEEELVEVPYQAIIDRTENETLFDLGSKQIWIPNKFVGHVDEMRGVIDVAPEFAEEEELV